MRTYFIEQEMKAFEPAEKIGLVACVNPGGLPHISLITSIMAPGPRQLTLGQFCKGLSKAYIQTRPDIGFLVMTMDKKMWRGRARWTHLRTEGREYERYNEIPMFRYNTYFGINTVHYLDLIETSEGEALPMFRIVLSAMLTKMTKGAAAAGNGEPILKPFAQDLFNQLDALKFVSYIGPDGFPVIVPVVQCQAADSRRLAFSPLAFKEELMRIPEETTVAVFALTMKMEGVLIRGIFRGYRRKRGLVIGIVDIKWVYNSMPPAHGQIYPEVPLKPVVDTWE
ncbi:MAG: hypothetical protein K9N21_19650 [Deltaproteobacteria bacterium]|nr:hypothetical protein [Deltaproteobacteria bacterium]